MSVETFDKPAKILLAEDDEINRLVLGAFLTDSPEYDLTFVEDGRAALEAATTTQFDLMIFDQNMPFITGDRVIRHLRASNSINARTPVIRLSADTSHETRVMVEGIATASLPKPLHKDMLLAAIRAVLLRT